MRTRRVRRAGRQAAICREVPDVSASADPMLRLHHVFRGRLAACRRNLGVRASVGGRDGDQRPGMPRHRSLVRAQPRRWDSPTRSSTRSVRRAPRRSTTSRSATTTSPTRTAAGTRRRPTTTWRPGGVHRSSHRSWRISSRRAGCPSVTGVSPSSGPTSGGTVVHDQRL